MSDVHKGLAKLAQDSVYAFKAERYNLGRSRIGTSRVLRPDAANLAEVLSVLSGHPHDWQQFNDSTRKVFPNVAAISIEPVEIDQVEIKVWNQNPTGLPQELAIPLSQSGSGIGQVLSILAVVLMSRYPHTIIIDEPQSFLHPGALRALVQILASHKQHQFIIATHSPTVITASRPAQVLRIIRPQFVTEVQSLNPADNQDLRLFLGDIGARLSDVFGSESILWVDGATEETCFPEIYRRLKQDETYGTKILGVRHTGDFDSRNSRTILDIYRRLSTSQGLLPPAVGFLFDRENRSPTDIQDLKRQARGKLDFLERRMYENYLLDPAAISKLVNELPDFRDSGVSEDEVADWIYRKGSDQQFISRTNLAVQTNDWLIEVNGAALLDALFQDLSDSRYTYSKIEHGFKLTEFILDRCPDALREIANKIYSLLHAIRDVPPS